MGLEAATYIHQLVTTNPIGASDPKEQGDDHLRLIKQTIQNTFPAITGPVTVTQAQLNSAGSSGITGLANPTASSGPAVVNGSAVTAMRSDAAPPVNLTASYSWTGLHTFSLKATFSAGIAFGAADFTGLANPSGLTGLTAVNGTATTAMRSDARHAIDQAIACFARFILQ